MFEKGLVDKGNKRGKRLENIVITDLRSKAKIYLLRQYVVHTYNVYE